MRIYNFIKRYSFLLSALLVACNICEERDMNVGQIKGHFLKQDVARERISDFFNSENGSFFPMEDWMMDFEYKARRKKLYLTLLGVETESKSGQDYSVYMSNDSIFVNQNFSKENVFSHSIVNEDLKYVINGVSPKKYVLIYMGKTIELDLSEINEKESYSILADGSFVVVSDEVCSDEI